MKKSEKPSNKKKVKEYPGVLLSDEIERYVDEFGLISDFNKKNLKPASYDLSLGDEYRLGGKPRFLNKEKRYLTIPPYEVAIVKTLEKLKMPKNLIGRWNLRISYVYKGLLWVGGPQVDPGFEGHLYCPLYNLSTRPVILEYEEPFATIDFIKTTPFIESKSKLFEPKRKDAMSEYDSLESAPKDTIERVERTRRRMELFEASTLTIIGIIIAALAIISTSTFTVNIQLWPAVIWIIIAAVVTFIAGFFIGHVVGRND